MNHRWGRWIPAILAVVFTLVYAVASVLRFRRFVVSSWDNAIFEQAVSAYARFAPPIVSVKGPGFNILGDHFSPIDALLAPAYWIYPHGETLLVAQAVLVGVSVYCIARLGVKHLGLGLGALVAVLYGLSFGVQSAVAADFHEVAFAVPLLALAGSAYLEGRYTAVVLWSIPLLLVKEDMGLTLVAIGAVLSLAGARRCGFALVGIGGIAWLVIVWFVIPTFNVRGGYDYGSVLGADGGLVHTLFSQLGTKLGTVVLTFAITGFTALFSRWSLVVVPTFAWRFVADNPYYWGTDWHYSLILMPIVFVAMIDVLSRPRAARLRLPAVALASLVTAVTLQGSLLWTVVTAQLWVGTPNDAAARGAIAALPTHGDIESDIGLLTHLTDRRNGIYWVGTIGNVSPQCVVLDVRFTPNIGAQQYAKAAHGGSWRTVYSNGGYTVACRAS